MIALVNLALTNRNPHSQDQSVIINIETGMCTFADQRKVELKRFINESDFRHPLLEVPFIPAPDHLYHHEYDDIDGLLYTAVFVYSTLLHVDKPRACQFKINPSAAFPRSIYADDIYFSMHRHKLARESICIAQLEALVSDFSGYEFQFSEHVIIDDQFTLDDLSPSVDGDSLYNSHLDIVKLMETPRDFSRYELRYINLDMGFGVFSRDVIKQEEIISLYAGIKKTSEHIALEYVYKGDFDSLNMYLDARFCGNITRFINHAPDTDTSKKTASRVFLLEANVKTKSHYINGIEIVVYLASKDIQKGEQLLVDYGASYFGNFLASRFKTNGTVINPNKKRFQKKSQKKLNQIRIMASHAIKEAQRYLRLRMAGIVFVVFTLMGLLNRLL